MGLGVLATRARRVSDGMFTAAAQALGKASDSDAKGPGHLLPPVERLRAVARSIARAVARQARAEDLCEPFEDEALEDLLDACTWTPAYRPYVNVHDNHRGQSLRRRQDN
ncbi:MAG TPA: malic enzyme-like NAD(P)-binding protein, partial [Salinisphaeraceae bacterium]|nr:malic enzyme-like NAD(P)-binding protein [Salinisphaeraceae bacterium]